MKEKLLTFCNWAQANWLALVIFMVILMLLFVCAVMLSWLIGYWANALYGTKFELSSCWSGITVVVTGLAAVAALAKAGWTKYGQDSQYNSPLGEVPVNPVSVIKSEVLKR